MHSYFSVSVRSWDWIPPQALQVSCVSMQGSSIGKEAMMGTFVLRPENLGS